MRLHLLPDTIPNSMSFLLCAALRRCAAGTVGMHAFSSRSVYSMTCRNNSVQCAPLHGELAGDIVQFCEACIVQCNSMRLVLCSAVV